MTGLVSSRAQAPRQANCYMAGNGEHVGIPISPALASFKNAILNSRCHKSESTSIKEEQVAQDITERSYITKQESTFSPYPTTVLTPCLPLSLMSLFGDHLPSAKSSVGCGRLVWRSSIMENSKLPSVLCSAEDTDFFSPRLLCHPLSLEGMIQLNSGGKGHEKVPGPCVLEHCPEEQWTMSMVPQCHLINPATVSSLTQHLDLQSGETEGYQQDGHQHVLPLSGTNPPSHLLCTGLWAQQLHNCDLTMALFSPNSLCVDFSFYRIPRVQVRL